MLASFTRASGCEGAFGNVSISFCRVIAASLMLPLLKKASAFCNKRISSEKTGTLRGLCFFTDLEGIFLTMGMGTLFSVQPANKPKNRATNRK